MIFDGIESKPQICNLTKRFLWKPEIICGKLCWLRKVFTLYWKNVFLIDGNPMEIYENRNFLSMAELTRYYMENMRDSSTEGDIDN